MTLFKWCWRSVVFTAGFTVLLNVAYAQESKVLSAKEWFDKGIVLREAGNTRSTAAFEQAVEDLDGYINSSRTDDPWLARAYVLRGRCHALLGNNRQAVEDLTRAIELSPEGDIYYVRSLLYEWIGNKKQSVEDLKTAAGKGNQQAQGELMSKGIQWR